MSLQTAVSDLKPSPYPTAINAYALAWLKAQPAPQVVVRPDLEVLWVNDAAMTLINDGSDLSIRGAHLLIRDDLRTNGLLAFLSSDDSTGLAWVFKRQRSEGYFAIKRDRPLQVSHEVALSLTFIATSANDRYVWCDIKPIFGLTRSEAALVKRLVSGQPIQAAADDLRMSVDTARTHIRNVYGKLGISSREQLFAAVLPFRIG